MDFGGYYRHWLPLFPPWAYPQTQMYLPPDLYARLSCLRICGNFLPIAYFIFLNRVLRLNGIRIKGIVYEHIIRALVSVHGLKYDCFRMSGLGI